MVTAMIAINRRVRPRARAVSVPPKTARMGFRARKISAPEARPMAMNRTWSVATRGRSASFLPSPMLRPTTMPEAEAAP